MEQHDIGTKKEAKQQIDVAEEFVKMVENYCKDKI
jgi:hypothetical protein